MSALPPSPSSSPSRSPSPMSTPNLRQNPTDPNVKWLVQKFGGTSVGKFPAKIAKDVVSAYMGTHRVAIVCSARSGSTKALGTTNLLLRAASEALIRRPKSPRNNSTSPSGTMTPLTLGLFGQIKDIPPRSPPDTPTRSRSSSADEKISSYMTPLSPLTVPVAGQAEPKFNPTVDMIREQHCAAAKESIQNPEIRKELEEEIDRDCDWLRSFLFASQVVDEVSPRSKDSIIGLGEKLACKLMTAILRDQGIDAEYVSLENIVPDVENELYSSAGGNITLDQGFYDRVAAAVGDRVRACGARVPVVTGFFSPVPGSLLLQIGRGYTDLLSALLAVGLSTSDGASLLETTGTSTEKVDLDISELQIWKEVDGIFTADPRKVPTARVLDRISPDEAAELTYYGSEVVHPFTMEQVIRRKIPIRIKNVENPTGCGTVIFPDPPQPSEPPVVPKPFSQLVRTSSVPEQLAALTMNEAESPQKLPTAVTIKEPIIVINVNSNRKSVSHGFLAGIFGVLDRYGIVVDLISTSEVHVSMAIEDTFVATGGVGGKVLERVVAELKRFGTVSVHHNMAILSLVGKHMRHLVGIAGLMFTTLGKGNVNIEMISQGASEINISCVIDGRDAVKALNLIHQSCLRVPAPYSEDGTKRVGPWLY
ncbi:Aspartokinase [Stygiomarasmius scandens]|uniref:aspartate kinase n=1 Tax=Marasmiellus scandens TaxID=2682957 RepID=A0ABR1ITX7_9AGAR